MNVARLAVRRAVIMIMIVAMVVTAAAVLAVLVMMMRFRVDQRRAELALDRDRD